MNRLIYILVFSLLTCCSVNALEIVYPKTSNSIIDSNVTAFIGNEKDTNALKINGVDVILHPSGGFKFPVKLNFGRNVFVIDNGKERKIYNITRNQYLSKENFLNLKPIFYNQPKTIVTTGENIPLRSTPVNAGLNRLQHLQSGIIMEATGEYNGFYKVLLGRDDYAWLAKDNAKIIDSTNVKGRIISSYSSQKDNKKVYTINLDKKLPYVIYDGEDLSLIIYNVEDTKFDKYELNIEHSGKPFGYSSRYEDTSLVVEVNDYPDSNGSLKDIKVTIDPGHGGGEYGAIGCLGDKEKDINLAISKILKEKLQKAGAQVYMTRDDDRAVSLSDRVKKTNENNSKIFISIHSNALPDSRLDKDISGTEVYYFYPQARDLAKNILKSITTEVGTKDNGVKGESFAVIRNTNAVSVLVEVGYIINPEENVKLRDKKFQEDVANAILHGLENYLK